MTILSDVEIKEKIASSELIVDGDSSLIGPACYELRMGPIYYDLTEDDKRIDATEEGCVLIKPGHRVVLITLETLKIPNDIIARVTSKGSLFSIGLSPVGTYADPGFVGNLGIVTQNFSDRYIKIPIGEPIAKTDFSLLSRPSENPYRGQHGFQTQIWPIKHQLQMAHEEVKNDRRVGSEEEEAFKILPPATATAIRALQIKQRKINISLIFLIILNMLLIAGFSANWVEPVLALTINLISSAIIGLIIWFWT